MIYVLIWILFGIFSAIIANNKNRSVVAWFFVGLFFGPFGLIVGFLDKVNVDGGIVDQDNNQVSMQKNTNSRSYKVGNSIYVIKVKDLDECWNNARSTLLQYYNENFPNSFKIKKNDKDELYGSGHLDGLTESYYKMTPELRKDGEYIIVDALNGINFSHVGNVAKEEATEAKVEVTNNIDDFMKLAELYKQGFLTDEEFEIQKKKYL